MVTAFQVKKFWCVLFIGVILSSETKCEQFPVSNADCSRDLPEVPKDTLLKKVYLRYTSSSWLFNDGTFADNETIELGLSYAPPQGWPLSDLELDMIIRAYLCSSYEYGYGRPLPPSTYVLDNGSALIHVKIPGTFFRQNCYFFFKIAEIRSKQCNTKQKPDIPVLKLEINCDTVTNSPCSIPVSHSPTCAFTDFHSQVLNPNSQDEKLVSVLVSWRSLHVSRRHPVLYYALRWGGGKALNVTGNAEIDSFFSDLVEIREVEGITQTCSRNRSRTASSCDTSDQSAVLPNLKRGKLYGVQICAVYESSEEFPTGRSLATIQSHKLIIA